MTEQDRERQFDAGGDVGGDPDDGGIGYAGRTSGPDSRDEEAGTAGTGTNEQGGAGGGSTGNADGGTGSS